MSLRSLLRKELHWSKHHVLALLFVLVLVPSAFAYATVAFETVIPQDTPIAVVPQNDQVTDDDVTIIEGPLRQFSDPVVVQNESRARRMLDRESVYAIVTVPPDIAQPGANVTFELVVHGSVVPFKAPSQAIRDVMADQLDRYLPANVSVEREVVGADSTLSEYFLSMATMVFVLLFAFTYVPYNLAQEAPVVDRLRAETSLETVVGAKLVWFTALLAVPLAVFQGMAVYLGYSMTVLAPGAVLALGLTFVALAAVSMAVMVLLEFSTTGRFVNAVLLLGVAGFSGLGYPVGYFSPLRKTIARLLPTHYATIVTRSAMLKDLPLTLFADWFVVLGALALGALIALKLSVVTYRVRAT